MKRILCFLFSVSLLLALASCGFEQGSDEETDQAIEHLFHTEVDDPETVGRYAKGYSVDTASYKYLKTDLDGNGYQDYLLCASATKADEPEGEYKLFLPFLAGDRQLSTAFSKVIDCRSEDFKLLTDGEFHYYLAFFREVEETFVASFFAMDDRATKLSDSFARAEDGAGELAYYYSDTIDLLNDDGSVPFGDNLRTDEESFQGLYDVYVAYSYEAACENGILDGFVDYYDGETASDAPSNDVFYEETENAGAETSPAVTTKAKSTAPQTPSKPVVKEPAPATSASEFLTPTKDELKTLASIFGDNGQYDCNSPDAVERAYGMTMDYLFGCYGYYAGLMNLPAPQHRIPAPDPLGLLKTSWFCGDETGYDYNEYSVFPGDGVDWVLRNVMNVEPDHDYIGEVEYDDGETSVWFYYLDGNYYVKDYDGGFESELYYQRHTVLPDGKVVVDVVEVSYWDDTSAVGSLPTDTRVTAGLKEIDGKRVWSIYKIEDLRDY